MDEERMKAQTTRCPLLWTDSRLVQAQIKIPFSIAQSKGILDVSPKLKTKTKVIKGELTIKSTEGNAVDVIHVYK